MISQSKRKIKPHREDRLSGPEVSAKTCPLERGTKKLSLIFLTVALKYASSTNIALDLSFPSTFIAIALKSNCLPAGDFDKFLSHSTFDFAQTLVHESPMRSVAATVRLLTSL